MIVETKTGIRIGSRYVRPVRVTREEEIVQSLLLPRKRSESLWARVREFLARRTSRQE